MATSTPLLCSGHVRVGARHNCMRPMNADEFPRIGVVTEAFADRPLVQVMDWLAGHAPAVTALELGAGGYAPTPHCDLPRLLRDAAARRRWLDEITARGF